MQVTKKELSDVKVSLYIVADEKELNDVKNQVINKLSVDIKIPGFRPGKAPQSVAERNIDSSRLQTEFLGTLVNELYREAILSENLRPVETPKITINKFVPFHTLEFTAELAILGKVKLADYKNIKLTRHQTEVKKEEIDKAVDELLVREAEKQLVNRASKKGDEVLVDFEGFDAKTKKPVPGTKSKNYPIILGSDLFIPGFEEHLIGTKAGQDKEFVITFPANYGVKNLQNKRVKFVVKTIEVKSVKKPVLDNKIVDKFGPFKTVDELLADIKKEILAEKNRLAEQARRNELVTKVVAASSVSISDDVIDRQVDYNEEFEKNRLIQQGLTWKEYLESENLSEEKYRKDSRPQAEQQIKTGLVLGEIAIIEKIEVKPEELDSQINLLKQQYNDAHIREELDKPEVRADINNRIMVDKVISKMMGHQLPQVN
jgi:trigger factor